MHEMLLLNTSPTVGATFTAQDAKEYERSYESERFKSVVAPWRWFR